MSSTDTIEGPTPNGGVRTTVIYLNAERQPVEKTEAVACEIIEYDADGEVVGRSYAEIGKEGG